MSKDSFVFYRSFQEAIQEMPKKHQLDIYRAIVDYALDNKEPTLCGAASALWKSFRPQIDASAKRYENAKKGGKYGKLGGRPRKDSDEKKPLKGYETKTLNANVNDNHNVNDNANANAPGSGEAGGQAQKSNQIPTLSEVEAECQKRGFKISPQKFFDYYNASGWKTTENEPVHDWRKMLAIWEMKEKLGAGIDSDRNRQKTKNRFNNFGQRSYTEDELEAQLVEGVRK